MRRLLPPSVRRKRAGLASLLCAALLTVACGGPDATEPAPTSTRGATTVPRPSTTTVPDSAFLTSLVGSSAENPLSALAQAVDHAAAECGDFERWRTASSAVVGELAGLDPYVEEIRDLTESLDRRAYAWELGESIFLTRPCDGSWTAPDADIAAATRTVVEAYDAFTAPLLATRAPTETPLWYFQELRGLYRVNQLRRAGDEPSVWVIGSSVGMQGVDSAAVEARIGATVVNVSVAGGFPETAPTWLDEVAPSAGSQIVWVIGAAEPYSACTPEQRAELFDARAEMRAAAFTGPGWLADAEPVDRLIGGLDLPDGPLTSAIRDGFDATLRNRALDETVAYLRRGQVESHTPAIRAAAPCEARLDTMRRTIEGLVGDGFDVLVVALPIHRDLSQEFPGEATGLADAVGEVLSSFEQLGADTLDLTLEVSDELVADALHLNPEGRRIVSEIIADTLTG